MPAKPAPAPPEPIALLTPDDVAALLRTTAKQVGHMRARGQLPPARKWPGLGYRWVAGDFHRWMAEQARVVRR